MFTISKSRNTLIINGMNVMVPNTIVDVCESHRAAYQNPSNVNWGAISPAASMISVAVYNGNHGLVLQYTGLSECPVFTMTHEFPTTSLLPLDAFGSAVLVSASGGLRRGAVYLLNPGEHEMKVVIDREQYEQLYPSKTYLYECYLEWENDRIFLRFRTKRRNGEVLSEMDITDRVTTLGIDVAKAAQLTADGLLRRIE